jgi:hypothetical protein
MATILDIFTASPYSSQRFELMRKMVVKGDDKGHISLWDHLMDIRYEKYVPKYVSRIFHYVVEGPPSDLNMLALHFLYFLMLAYEPYCQRIVLKELEAKGDVKRAEFFTKTFLLELQLYYEILFIYPYTRSNVVEIIRIVIAKIKTSWRTQSPYNFIVTRNAERELMERDKAAIEKVRMERAKKKNRKPDFEQLSSKKQKREKKKKKKKIGNVTLDIEDAVMMTTLRATDINADAEREKRRRKRNRNMGTRSND